MKTISRLEALAATALLAGALAACDDPSDNNTDPDVIDSMNGDGDADTTIDPDVDNDTTPDGDVTPDVDQDGDEDVDTASCTTSEAEAKAAEAINAQDTATAQTLLEAEEVTVGINTWTEAEIDAGLGGNAASQDSPWIYIDLDTGAQLELSDVEALQNDAWDLAFKRTNIRLNSGDSGLGNWLVTRLDETTWEDAEVPARDSGAVWASDDFVDDETCELNEQPFAGIETAFGQWYDYVQPPEGGQGSIEVPGNVVFALYNMGTHATMRLQITGYESSTANYELRWGAFGEPCVPSDVAAEVLNEQDTAAAQTLVTSTVIDGGFALTVDAALGGVSESADSPWIYIDLDTGAQLDLTDVAAADDSSWDIALKRTLIRLNSADSGPGTLMTTRVNGTTWETVEVPGRDSGAEWYTDDFVDDETCETDTSFRGDPVTAFGQWYDYVQPPGGGRGEIVAPQDTVWVIYNMTGHATHRLQIQDYDEDNATYDLRWAAFASDESGR